MFGLDDRENTAGINQLSIWGEWFFRRCVNNYRENGTQLVLAGNTGNGKTHVAKRIFDQVNAWGVEASLTAFWNGRFPTTVWIEWPRIANLETEEFEDWLIDAREAQVVFMDDVGSEADRYKSGEPIARLRRVLSLCDRKWLLVTTNLSQPEFMDAYDARVADRLSAAHWCELSGVPSYRPKLKTVSAGGWHLRVQGIPTVCEII